jgi:hypothetical protein
MYISFDGGSALASENSVFITNPGPAGIDSAMGLLLAFLLLSGCAPYRHAESTKDQPDCRTIVEGTYRAIPQGIPYEGNVPALIIKKSSGLTEALEGNFLRIDSSGILFDQKRVGALYDPEPKLYACTEIQCAIDSARKVMYGVLPPDKSTEWDIDLFLGQMEDSTAKPYRLMINSGESFSVCMDSGTYYLKEIHFHNGLNIDSGVVLPKLTFHLSPHKVNYLGTLTLNGDSTGCAIPYKMEYRVGRDFLQSLGIVGYIAAVATTNNNILGLHFLRAIPDSSYKSAFALPLEYSQVTMEENPKARNSINK